jgi:type IV secretory pathway ATPase VirB11/archaellum biosynthesis ATPase
MVPETWKIAVLLATIRGLVADHRHVLDSVKLPEASTRGTLLRRFLPASISVTIRKIRYLEFSTRPHRRYVTRLRRCANHVKVFGNW